MSAAALVDVEPVWSHVWRWLTVFPERRGKPCRIVAWADGGKRVLVEFQDGERILVARPAVRARRK